MRFGRIWLPVLVLLVSIGCGEAPSTPEVEPIIGVKIYQTERDLPGLFRQWSELGVNTLFVARDLVSRDEFHELAARYQMDIFVIFPIFYAPEELAADANLWAVTDTGERAKEDWVEFACPTREAFRARRIEEAVEIARMCQPAGLSIDFIRYFAFWEMVGPERPAGSLADTCFCSSCLESFARHLDVERSVLPTEATAAATWIRDNAAAEWEEFKTRTISTFVEEIAAAVRAVDPALSINLHVVPWRSGDYDGAITRIIGQQRSTMGSAADFLSPMCYSFMLHRDAAWVTLVVEDVAAQSSCPVLPSIQVAAAYREGENFTPEAFEEVLTAALKPPSAGVVFWSWDHFEADERKAEIVRQVIARQ